MDDQQGVMKIAKPKVVRIAANLYWVSLCLGFINTLHISQSMDMKHPIIVAILTIGSYGLVWFLIRKAVNGSNAFRIINLILIVIGINDYLSFIRKTFSTSVIFGYVSIIILALQVVAIGLLFTPPANAWFKSKK